MTMTLVQLQVLNIGDHFHSSFQPTCLHCYFNFLLINDVRMTTLTHQLLSRKKNKRQKSDNASANIPLTVLWCLSLCCAWAMQKFSFNQADMTRCLAKSYPTSRQDVAITNGHCSRMVFPLTRLETQKLSVWEPAVHWAKHFFYRIARI